MTHSELIEVLAGQTGLTKKDVTAVIDSLPGVIATAVSGDGEVRIVGLGTLRKRATKARTGRNPRTGETIEVPAGAKVQFLPAKSLKTSVAPAAL